MRFKIIVFLLLIANLSFGQQGDNSPYSRFGIGDIKPYAFTHIQQMGGMSTAYSDFYHINIANPASYANLISTSFDLGINAKYATLNQNGEKFNSWSGSFDYISIAFPLSNTLNDLFERVDRDLKFGMGFTVRQNSSVSYNISSSEFDQEIGVFERNYQGNGGTYEFLWGNAFKLKDFSFGINLGYVFGKLEYDKNLFFPDNSQAFNNIFSDEYNVKGFNYNIGTSYRLVLNRKEVIEKKEKLKALTFGLRGNGATSLSSNLTEYAIGLRPIGANSESDTLFYNTDIEGKIKLPLKLAAGVTYYYGEKLALGIDYERQSWSDYYNEASGEVKGTLNNTYNVSIGGFYRPNFKSYKFKERVYYRFGANYGTDPRIVEGEQIKNYSISGGFGLPFSYQRKISHANIGFEYGKHGTSTPITESYFKINFGFTFNDDEWFLQRKYK